MGERDVAWLGLYDQASARAQAAQDQVSAIAWSLLAGEEFRLLGKRCRAATLEWPDGPPMELERMRAWAADMLTALNTRREAA